MVNGEQRHPKFHNPVVDLPKTSSKRDIVGSHAHHTREFKLAVSVAQLYISHVYKLHGLPQIQWRMQDGRPGGLKQ